MKQARLGVWLVLMMVLALAPIGCGGGKAFTPEDFKKVTKGMTEAQVAEILGSPAETLKAGDISRTFYTVGDKYYSVPFKSGKVDGELMGPTTKMEVDLMKGLMKALPK